MKSYKDTPFYFSNDDEFPVVACIFGDDVVTHQRMFGSAPAMTVEEADGITNLIELLESTEVLDILAQSDVYPMDVKEGTSKWVCYLSYPDGGISRLFLGDPREFVIFMETIKCEVPPYLLV